MCAVFETGVGLRLGAVKGEFKTQDSPGCSNLSFKNAKDLWEKLSRLQYENKHTKNQQKMDSTFLRSMTFSNHSALLLSLVSAWWCQSM